MNKLENIWTIEDVERVFFEAEKKNEKPVEFGVETKVKKEKGSDDEEEE